MSSTESLIMTSVVKILSIFVLVILIPVLYSYWYYTEYDTLDKILSQYDTAAAGIILSISVCG